MNRKLVAMIVVLFLMACETSPQPALQWVKPGAGPDELKADQDACVNSAMKPNLGTDVDIFQAQGRVNVFMRCMNERGWEQVLPESEG